MVIMEDNLHKDFIAALEKEFLAYLESLINVKKIGCIGMGGFSNQEKIFFFYTTPLFIDFYDDYEQERKTKLVAPANLSAKKPDEMLPWIEDFYRDIKNEEPFRKLKLRKGFDFLLDHQNETCNVNVEIDPKITVTNPSFDPILMADFATKKIRQFSRKHPKEIFYAFAIDADMLCMNSISEFEKSLTEYQKKWPGSYSTEKEVTALKYNPGDWKYQGFAKLSEKNGFDQDLYEKHYEASDAEQPGSEYANAMDELLGLLKKSDAFESIKTTVDFRIYRVEHNY